MKRFIEGVDRSQTTLFPERLEDWIGAEGRVIVKLDLCKEFALSHFGQAQLKLRQAFVPPSRLRERVWLSQIQVTSAELPDQGVQELDLCI